MFRFLRNSFYHQAGATGGVGGAIPVSTPQVQPEAIEGKGKLNGRDITHVQDAKSQLSGLSPASGAGKPLASRPASQSPAQPTPGLKTDNLGTLSQKQLQAKETKLLEQADQLLKEREDKRVVNLSLSSLKQSTQQVKTSDDIYKSLKSLKVPSDLKVTIALKSEGNKPISLIPPGKELKGRDDLEKLFTMATELLEKHDAETFGNFSAERIENQLTGIKSNLGEVGDQIENKGGKTSWKEQYKKLEERTSTVSVFASDSDVNCSAPPKSSVNIFLDDLNGTGSIKTSGDHSDNTGQDDDHSDLVNNRTGSKSLDDFAIQSGILRPEPDYDLDLPDNDDLITHTDEDSPGISDEDDDLISETGGDDTDDTTVTKTKTGDNNPTGQEINSGDNDNRGDKTGEDGGDSTDNDENRTGDGDGTPTDRTTKSGTEIPGSGENGGDQNDNRGGKTGGSEDDGTGGGSGGDKGPHLNAAQNRQRSGDGKQDNSDIRRRVVERQRNTIDFGTPDFTKVQSKIDNRIRKTTPRKKVDLNERVRQDLDKAIQKGKKKTDRLQKTNSDTTEIRGQTLRQSTTNRSGKTSSKTNTRGSQTKARDPVNLEERVRQDLEKATLKGKTKTAPLQDGTSGTVNDKGKTRQNTAPDNRSNTSSKINTRGSQTKARGPVNLEERVRQDLDKATLKGKAKTAQSENNNSSTPGSKRNSQKRTAPVKNATASKINTRGTKSQPREPVNLDERVRQDLDDAAEKGRLKKR